MHFLHLSTFHMHMHAPIHPYLRTQLLRLNEYGHRLIRGQSVRRPRLARHEHL